MRHFLVDKRSGETIVLNKDRETLLRELEEDDVAADYEVLTPEEYQSREIAAARKKQIEEDNPTLSKLFPRTAQKIADKGEKPLIAKAGSDDFYSLPGRALGAGIDAATSFNQFGKNFKESLGQPEADEQERSWLGSLAQGALRDPMLIPSTAFTPLKIAKVAKMGSGVKSTAGRAALERGLKPAIEGATVGTATGIARPVVTDDDMRLKGDIVGGMGGTLLFKNLSKLLGRNLSKAEYDQLLMKLANRNNAKAAFLDAAATPEGRAEIPKNYKTQAEIAEDLLDYKHFDDAKFPEQKTVNEFLDRSQGKESAGDIATELAQHGERIKEKAGGGGLTTDEAASAARLKKEAEIFYDQNTGKAEPSKLLGPDGQPLATKPPPPKAREMTAAQINNARQRIGNLLEDDFKRQSLGKPDGEVQALKKAYFGLREKLMKIAESEGETAAVQAYRSMAAKLGAREALFDALRVPENKNIAQDRLTKNLENIAGNERKAKMFEQFANFDKSFGTDFGKRVKWMNVANALGESADGKTFRQLRGDNNYFTGKGFRQPFFDNFRGRTVASAVKKLEKAKKPGSGGRFFGSSKEEESPFDQFTFKKERQ
jgi:hypothetical protein